MEIRPLKDWAVFECQWPEGTGAPTRHLVGTSLGVPRCSSAVVIDVVARTGISTKGNVYELHGEPGLRLHAMFAWHHFVETYGPVAVREITEELFPDLVAQLNGPESIPGISAEQAVVALQAGDGTLLSDADLAQALRKYNHLAENKGALQSSTYWAGDDGPLGASSFVVEGEIVEVLRGLGLAHVRGANGVAYGLNPTTPGIAFEALRAGQRVQCRVTAKFHRVLHAEVLVEW